MLRSQRMRELEAEVADLEIQKNLLEKEISRLRGRLEAVKGDENDPDPTIALYLLFEENEIKLKKLWRAPITSSLSCNLIVHQAIRLSYLRNILVKAGWNIRGLSLEDDLLYLEVRKMEAGV